MTRIRALLTPPAPDAETGWRMFLTNCIAVSLGLITFPYAGVFAWLGVTWLAVLVVPIATFYLAAPLTMRLWGFTAQRASFFVLFGSVVALYSMGLGEGASIQLLYFAAVCLPLVVCRLDERWLVALGIGWPLTAYAMLEATGYQALGPTTLDAASQAWIHVMLVPTTFLILLVEVVYFAATSAAAQREVARRNRDLQALLDHMEDGVITVGADGRVAPERSAKIDAWFGAPAPNERVVDLLARVDESFAAWFDLGLEAVQDGVLPTDLALDQLPCALRLGDRHLRLQVKPLGSGPPFERLLLVFSDVTAHVDADRARAAQQELAEVFGRIQRDRRGFVNFIREAGERVQALEGGLDHAASLRELHTLKGNAALMGLRSFAERIHTLEDEAAEAGVCPADAGVRVRDAWREATGRLAAWIEEDDRLQVEVAEYEGVVRLAKDRVGHQEILRALLAWRQEPAALRLRALAEQGAALAGRLGKELLTRVDAGDLRVDPARWAPIWANMAHLIRNAVDHGVEAPEAREAARKGRAGCLVLRAYPEGSLVVVEVADDGAGVDWARVAEKATAANLPTATRQDLIDALFTDGLSTRDAATDISGRGVGLSALKEAVQRAGGDIEVSTELGRGTRFTLRVPTREAEDRQAA